MDAAPAQPWAGEGGPPPRGRMTPAEMEEERKQMQKEWRDLQSSKAAAAAAGQMVHLTLHFPRPPKLKANPFDFPTYC